MKNYTFKINVTVIINAKRFRILRILPGGEVQLEAEVDGSISNTTYDALLRQYAEKELIFDEASRVTDPTPHPMGRALSTFPEPVQQDAIRKKQYLDFFCNFGPFISTPKQLKPLIVDCAQKIGDKKPPSTITAYRWHRELIRHRRDHRAIIDRHDRKGGGGSRLHPNAGAILQEAIDDIYLNEQRNPVTAVYYEVVHRINKKNEFCPANEKLKIPSRATVFRAVASLDRYDQMSARFGKRIADMKFRTSGVGSRTTRILERVEIDHTPLDLFVIDSQTGLPQGRPTVTFAIDKYSRMPIGMHIGFSGTSIEAVFACLRHALIPKTYIRRDYPEIEHDWPCHGHIETLICDNGLEFHSNELERVAFELGTQLQFCPKRQPYYKGSIERFLKTLNFDFSRSLPGHSFAKWFQRDDYDPTKHAVVTFDQLMRYLHRWIVDIYAQKLHRGINSSPYRKWMDGANAAPPKLLSDLSRLDVTLGRTVERTLFHYGIELYNLRYNDQSLLTLRRQHGLSVKLEVRYYFDDISLIHVIDPITKEAISVPALEQEYAKGLSLEQHRLICARARETNAGTIDLASLARAKAEIREIVRELSFSKLQKKRQRAATYQGVKQSKTPPDSTCVPHVINASTPLVLSASVEASELPDIGALVFSRLPKSLEL